MKKAIVFFAIILFAAMFSSVHAQPSVSMASYSFTWQLAMNEYPQYPLYPYIITLTVDLASSETIPASCQIIFCEGGCRLNTYTVSITAGSNIFTLSGVASLSTDSVVYNYTDIPAHFNVIVTEGGGEFPNQLFNWWVAMGYNPITGTFTDPLQTNNYNAAYDLNHDGKIDLNDLTILAAAYGTTYHLCDLVALAEAFGSVES